MHRLVRLPWKGFQRVNQGRSFSNMLVDGFLQPAVISVHDLTFVRGDGAFEVVSLLPAPSNANVGLPVGLSLHLARFEATCRSLRLSLPHSSDRIAEWVKQVGQANGPGSCRIIMTRGQPTKDAPPKCLMLHDAPSTTSSASLRLKSMEAPWHIGYTSNPSASSPEYGSKLDLGGWKTIKWMSYAPNCLVTRLAQEHGADDALLVAADGRVLDGPNFAVGFVVDGHLRMVDAASNRMLPSCTQMMAVRAAQASGLPVLEGSVHIDEALAASAGFAMSATRHVMPLASLDGKVMSAQNAMLCDLQAAYWRLAGEELKAEDPVALGQEAAGML